MTIPDDFPEPLADEIREVEEAITEYAEEEANLGTKRLAEIPEKYTDGTGLSESDFVPNSDVADVIEPVLEFIDEHGLPDAGDGTGRADCRRH